MEANSLRINFGTSAGTVSGQRAPSVYNNDGETLLCSPQACDNGVWPTLNGENNVGDGELHVKLSCRQVAAQHTLNVGTESDLALEKQMRGETSVYERHAEYCKGRWRPRKAVAPYLAAKLVIGAIVHQDEMGMVAVQRLVL
jgi:hypothetical protein